MAIDIGIPCETCNEANMMISDPPVPGDYDIYGVLEPFCGSCGSGFEHVIITPSEHNPTVNFVDRVSNRTWRKIIDIIEKITFKPYSTYSMRMDVIQQLRSCCDTMESSVLFLSSHYDEKPLIVESVLIRNIYF